MAEREAPGGQQRTSGEAAVKEPASKQEHLEDCGAGNGAIELDAAGAFSSVLFEMATESPFPTSVSFESRPMSIPAALRRAAERSSQFE
jgi:hypothetical protein